MKGLEVLKMDEFIYLESTIQGNRHTLKRWRKWNGRGTKAEEEVCGPQSEDQVLLVGQESFSTFWKYCPVVWAVVDTVVIVHIPVLPSVLCFGTHYPELINAALCFCSTVEVIKKCTETGHVSHLAQHFCMCLQECVGPCVRPRADVCVSVRACVPGEKKCSAIFSVTATEQLWDKTEENEAHLQRKGNGKTRQENEIHLVVIMKHLAPGYTEIP